MCPAKKEDTKRLKNGFVPAAALSSNAHKFTMKSWRERLGLQKRTITAPIQKSLSSVCSAYFTVFIFIFVPLCTTTANGSLLVLVTATSCIVVVAALHERAHHQQGITFSFLWMMVFMNATSPTAATYPMAAAAPTTTAMVAVEQRKSSRGKQLQQ